MFAYLASHNSRDRRNGAAVLQHFAEENGISAPTLRQVVFPKFQLDFFDTGNELHCYKDERFVLLLSGEILNKEAIQSEVGSSSDNDAELIFWLFRSGHQNVVKVDGHFSFLLFDAQEKKISLLSDRFQRYSLVYAVTDATYASSHSYLLHPFLHDKSFDMESFSQAIHFRWFTGARRLFAGVHQVLPGSMTHIDKRGNTQREAVVKIAFQRETNLDQEYWVQQVDEALDRTLSLIAKKHDAIGVPLSGGVDSSLLLAKAKEHFRDVVAVSGRFLNGENPELENACYFAKKLGVRHVIVDIDDDYIRDIFPKIIRLNGQPPRNYSDIAFAKILQKISSEVGAFLYGEAADTLFGSNEASRIVTTDKLAAPFKRLPVALQKFAAHLIPERPGRLSQLKKVLANGIDSLVTSVSFIGYVTPPWRVFPCSKIPSSDPVLDEYLADESLSISDRVTLQTLSTGVMDHMVSTGRLATYYGLQMYAPFLLSDLLSVAVRLPLELQNGSAVEKVVLRELACRYFDRERIYSKKHGFPTPTTNWLNGPLQERVMQSIRGAGEAKRYYSADALSSLSVEDDFEHFWFAICLDEILSQVSRLSRRSA